MTATHTCAICGRTDAHKTYEVPEFQFGMGGTFTYFACSACGCLQIAAIPENLGRYYPDRYYSHAVHGKGSGYRRFKDRLEARRNLFCLTGKGPVGRILQAFLPEMALPKLARVRPSKDARILDVGSGTGRPLFFLAGQGYRRVTGVDPFIKGDIEGPNGLRVFKKELSQLQGTWDIIMFNHSLEHMPDNLAPLVKARELLADDGWCIVSVPTVDSYAWRHYGIHWIGLDAPRHLYLHSKASFKLLAEKAGFRIEETLFDSNTGQFWASENFRRGLTMKADGSRWTWIGNRIGRALGFLPQYLRAERLNKQGDGDMIAFFLKKASP